MSLPSPRALLTSIFETLTTLSTLSIDSTNLPNPSNPFESLSTSQKALLTTLHVLFPSPLVLHAFDLLDRGLVTRISLTQREDPDESQNIVVAEPTVDQPAETLSDEIRNSDNEIYQVHSSQSPKASGRSTYYASVSSSLPIYTVHLHAWNCSCAAFAFSAFPLAESSSSPWLDFRNHSFRVDLDSEDEVPDKWVFGGLMLENTETEGMPICKHLLACLFVDRWESILGTYANKRNVGKEVMAGTIWQTQ